MPRISAGNASRCSAIRSPRLAYYPRYSEVRPWLSTRVRKSASQRARGGCQSDSSRDEELQRIYKACDLFNEPVRGPGQRKWTGEDVKDFVYLSITAASNHWSSVPLTPNITAGPGGQARQRQASPLPDRCSWPLRAELRRLVPCPPPKPESMPDPIARARSRGGGGELRGTRRLLPVTDA